MQINGQNIPIQFNKRTYNVLHNNDVIMCNGKYYAIIPYFTGLIY